MSVGQWHLVVTGISHKTSTLEQREPLQIGHEEMAKANSVLSSLPGVKESLVLSTCNRIELYFVAEKDKDPFEITSAFFEQVKEQDVSDRRELFSMKKNRHAADHLLRVSAGLDSMVIGENQILGQLKDAYSSACAIKTAGKVVHRLFHQAFRVGKQVRTDTEMGKGACSVSSAAVDLLRTRVENGRSPVVLFVGVNQMVDLAARNLATLNGNKLLFANRTVEKAKAFAEKFGAEGYGLDKLPELLVRADIVISCTSSPTAVISKEMVAQALSQRSDRKLVIVDLAIPRDVAVNEGDFGQVEVHDLEAIKEFVKTQQARREAAIPQAEEIIERKLSEFIYWFQHVRYEPLYNGLDQSFEAIRKQEMAAILQKLPPELREELTQASRQLVDHLLHMQARATDTTI